MALAADLRTLRYLRAEQVAHRLWSRLRRPWFASPVYRNLCLPAAAPDLMTDRCPPAQWPGDPEAGRHILDGTIRLLGVEAPMASPVDWSAPGQPALWRFTLHYFEWLSDLAATGEDRAVECARTLVADWIGRHGSGPSRRLPDAWHPYPVSLRLFAWLAHAPWLLCGAPDRFRRAFDRALSRQARHLARCVEWDVGGNHAIKNLKALIAAGRAIPGHEAAGRRALQDLEWQAGRQILADGAHYERSPSYHLQVLMDLMDVRAVVEPDVPGWLDDGIGRMGRALAAYRLGDGGLGLFNDGDVGEPRLLSAVAGGPGAGEAPAALPDAGYYRLAAGDAVVLFDAGRCCPDDLPAHAHADCLSFEMSVGDHRLIVNSGTFAYQDPAWRNRLRGTASHSTVAIDDADSAEVHGVFRLGRRPRQVRGAQYEDETARIAEGSHDGYRHMGWTHSRRLALDADGRRLTGSDMISAGGGAQRGGQAIARFHLHPQVTLAPAGRHGVRLTAGDAVWRFGCPDCTIAVEAGVYAPRFGEMHDNRQIVLRRPLNDTGARFDWTLEAEAMGR